MALGLSVIGSDAASFFACLIEQRGPGCRRDPVGSPGTATADWPLRVDLKSEP